jgi:hypothetical protein
MTGLTIPDDPSSSDSCVATYSTKPAATPPITSLVTPPNLKNLKETDAATKTIAMSSSGRALSD